MLIKKIISVILIGAVCAGSAYGISRAVKRTTSAGTAIVVSAEALDYSWMASDSENAVDGYLATEAIQNVTVSSENGVESIVVEEGQEVKKGDTLLLYDTEQSRIELQKKMLDMEQIEINLQVARQNLRTLQNTRPTYGYTYNGGAAGNTTAIYAGEEQSQESSNAVAGTEPYDVLSADVIAFNESEGIPFADMGKQAYPYKYFVYGDREVKIEASFLQQLKSNAQSVGKPALFIQLEAHEKNIFNNLIQHNGTSYILFDVMTLKPIDSDWYVDFSAAVPALYQKTDANQQQSGEVTPAPDQNQSEGTVIPEEPTETPESIPPTEGQTEIEQEIENLFKEDDAVETVAEPEQTQAAQGETVSYKGMTSRKGGSGLFAVRKTERKDILPGRILFSENNTAKEESESQSQGSYIKPNSTYTKEELADAIKSTEEAVRTLELDKRDCAIQIRKIKKEITEGSVTAKLDGVVQNIATNIPDDGTPIMQVMSAGKIYVEGEMSENMLKSVKEGDAVTVQSWQTGMSYNAEIATISDYPSKEYFAGSYETDTSASSYKFTAAITDEYAYIQPGEFLQINLPETKDKKSEESDGNFYLFKAFILNEDGKFYVYRRGEDELLQKQEIRVGDSAGDGMQILEGVTRQDYLAFPYDKNTKEGAKTIEGSIDDLYGN